MNQQLIKHLFTYKDGELWWKKQPKPFYDLRVPAGKEETRGYIHIGFQGKKYLCHRLIWMYHYGDIPKGLVIDHINGNNQDNRIENLRMVTQQQNTCNRTKAKGYSWHKTHKRFYTHLTENGIQKFIGSFQTECGARLAYLFAKLNRTLNYG